MKKPILQKIIYLMGIYFFVGCSVLHMGKSTATSSGDTICFQANSIYEDSIKTPLFECTNFANNALNNYSIETLENKKFNFLKQSKRTVANMHQPELNDTIYTFADKANKIQIYRALQSDIIYEFDVTHTKLKLYGNIGPGMTKIEFANKFKIQNLIKNKIQIGNSDDTQIFTFYFINNKIKRINAHLYID